MIFFGKPVSTFPDHALMPSDGADQTGADHERRRAVDQNSHRQLSEAARRALTRAGALGRERHACP